MKYLKKYNETRGETLIDKKIVYLNDITDDLRDSGYIHTLRVGSKDDISHGMKAFWRDLRLEELLK